MTLQRRCGEHTYPLVVNSWCQQLVGAKLRISATSTVISELDGNRRGDKTYRSGFRFENRYLPFQCETRETQRVVSQEPGQSAAVVFSNNMNRHIQRLLLNGRGQNTLKRGLRGRLLCMVSCEITRTSAPKPLRQIYAALLARYNRKQS